MVQQVRVGAAGIDQSIRQHGESLRVERAGGHGPLLVGAELTLPP
jgi:hypothetical protein